LSIWLSCKKQASTPGTLIVSHLLTASLWS
jgi:hypothetical protein